MSQALGPKIIDETSITGDVYSKSIFPRKNGFSLTYDFNSSGTLVATLYLQCRNHRDEEFRTCNNVDFPTSPAGSSGSDELALVDAVHAEYRVFVDFTSGDGELNMYLNYGV